MYQESFELTQSSLYFAAMQLIPDIYQAHSLQIKETTLLPYQVYYDACCTLTRMEIQIASGEWVHCYQVNKVLMVSPQLSKVLRELAAEG